MIVRVVLLVLGLISGVLLAAAAFYGVFGPEPPKPAAVAALPAPPPPPPVMVVVAAKAIPTGTLITFADLRFAPVASGQQIGGDYVRTNAPTPNLAARRALTLRTPAWARLGSERLEAGRGETVARWMSKLQLEPACRSCSRPATPRAPGQTAPR